MSHITGTVQIVSPGIRIGPDSGAAPSAPGTWTLDFSHVPAPTGTKLLILHFRSASLPANNRLEVDLGYGTDVFTAADGVDFWTRPINIHVLPGGRVPIRYITDGATTGGVELDRYGRGEQHAGEPGHPSVSNSDPFLPSARYAEPTYDPFWFCHTPPQWENSACVPEGDVRRRVARSVGMIVTVSSDHVSTCSVTLVGPDLVLTAGHCMERPDEDAASSAITFDYEVTCDGARPPGYSARFHKVTRVIDHRNTMVGGVYHDYCLLQIRVPPGGLGVPYLDMRHDLPAIGEQIFGVHHPNGAVKKLSSPHPGFTTVRASGAAALRCDLDVSGGSSGSSLFDSAGRVVGVLSNGVACSLDYFPTATILQDIAAPTAPPATRDVMIVLDRSGSMSLPAGTGRTKMEEARDAASLFVQLVRAGTGNRVGLVSFSTAASAPVDFALAGVTAATKTALIGPPPYAGGVVGGLAAGGSTTIGGGLEAARLQFPAPGPSPRAILLLTDGLENTPPMVEAVEPALAGVDVDVIGFGTAASLDGALLTRLAESHNGLYTRAGTGLHLKKFFALAFGNIFEAGLLMDPELSLPRDQSAAAPIPFDVCGEETVTVVVGWEPEEAWLLVQLRSPSGAVVGAGSAGVERSIGRTWTFLRLPLPHGGERDGVWRIEVIRGGGGGEFPPPAVDVRFFASVIARGGPRLDRVPRGRRYYTGDVINPLVALKYPDGTFPRNARVEVTVSAPDTGVGDLLTQSRLRQPVTIGADTIPARQATLLSIEAASGRPSVGTTQRTFELFDDAAHEDGSFERDGIFGNPLRELLTVEGDYSFHCKATYGEGCVATRELTWSLHVDVGVDPSRSDVTIDPLATRPDGQRVVRITVVPRDRYGHHLGPGRLDAVSVSGGAGTTLTGPLDDNGDGSYSVTGIWDPTLGHGPGVVIGQPGRPPVVVAEPCPAAKERCARWTLLAWVILVLALMLFLLLLCR
jgi:V8-like Glu-specific endopeptidase